MTPKNLDYLSLPILCLVFGCSVSSDTSEFAASPNAKLVRGSITGIEFKTYDFDEVPLDGGVAVLLNDLGAYWVKDGKVYALNGLAKSYSPALSYGPPGLGKIDVENALRGDTKRQPRVLPVSRGVLSTKPMIRCDKFVIIEDVRGDSLGVRLETDLPLDTTIMVSVSRSYREVGEPGVDYSIDYLAEKSTVADWSQMKYLSISEAVWNSSLEKKQREMASLGLGFRVASTDETIDIRFVVPINQRHPRFDKNNLNLTGNAVEGTRSKHCRAEKSFVKRLRN